MTVQEALATDPAIDRSLLVEDARGWIEDCFSDVDVDDLDDVEVLQGVNRHYDGGLAQFIQDCY